MAAEPGAILLVYVTCATEAEARRIGALAVTRHLAACANIRAHEAIFRWEGAVRIAPEAGLMIKTVGGCLAALRDLIVAEHSYTLPCIVAWPIAEGHAPYCDWVRQECQPPP